MKNMVVAFTALLCTTGAWATTFTVKSSVSGVDFDWSVGSNYVGEPVKGPASGDTIVIPDGVTAIVNERASVQTGTCGLCNIQVDEGGTLQVYTPDANRTRTFVRTITGKGRVYQPSTSKTYDLAILNSCTFDGKFVGQLNYRVYKTFTLTDADQGLLKGSPILEGNARLRLARFTKNGNSILGNGSYNMNDGATIEYVGGSDIAGEVNSASFWSSKKISFDAGAYGAFTYDGKFGSSSDLWNLTLTGSNVNEAVFAGYREIKTANDSPLSIAKEGTGVWHVRKSSNSANKLGSVFEVREGTLRYDNFAPIGVNCSFGFANALYKHGETSATEGNRANYAILLGGENTEGFIQSATVSDTVISNFDRQVSLRTAGGIKSGEARVYLRGITAATAGEKTLILDGEFDGYDTVQAVTNGVGTVSIEKRGSGTWTVRPPCDITGKLAVKGGRLNIGNGAHNATYDWYRLRLKCNAFQDPAFADVSKECYETKGTKPAVITASIKRRMAISEFMFFDADGNRRCLYKMRHYKENVDIYPQTGKRADATSYIAEQATNRCALLCQPGHFALETYSADKNVMVTWQRALGAMFEGGGDQSDEAYANGTFHYNDWFDRTFEHVLDLNDESTWVNIVLRIEKGSSPLVACDYVPQDTAGTQWIGRLLTAFEVDGSTDGVTWDKLADFHLQELPTSTRGVSGSGATYSSRSLTAANLAKCVQLSRKGPEPMSAECEIDATVSVEPGATLAGLGKVTISKIALSEKGMGTLSGDGLALAEDGTFVVPKMQSGVTKVTYATTLKDIDGAAGLSGWLATTEDGKRSYNLGYDAATGNVTVERRGIIIMIR